MTQNTRKLLQIRWFSLSRATTVSLTSVKSNSNPQKRKIKDSGQASAFTSLLLDRQVCVCVSVCVRNTHKTRGLTCLCLCVFLHPAWSVWWQHLPASCTGELPSALPVGKGAFGTKSNSWPYSFSQLQLSQIHWQFTLLTRGGRSHAIQAGQWLCQVPSLSRCFHAPCVHVITYWRQNLQCISNEVI